MKVKELAQGLQQMMTEGLAELNIEVKSADGSEHNVLKLIVDKGVEVLEPSDSQSSPDPKPRIIID